MAKENQLQAECIRWFRLQYPQYWRLLFHIPNGGTRNIIEATRLKAQGVVPGVADLILLKPNRIWNGLCIELKVGKNKQTDNQIEWGNAVSEQGYHYVVCRTVGEFINLINLYLNENLQKN